MMEVKLRFFFLFLRKSELNLTGHILGITSFHITHEQIHQLETNAEGLCSTLIVPSYPRPDNGPFK